MIMNAILMFYALAVDNVDYNRSGFVVMKQGNNPLIEIYLNHNS